MFIDAGGEVCMIYDYKFNIGVEPIYSTVCLFETPGVLGIGWLPIKIAIPPLNHPRSQLNSNINELCGTTNRIR